MVDSVRGWREDTSKGGKARMGEGWMMPWRWRVLAKGRKEESSEG